MVFEVVKKHSLKIALLVAGLVVIGVLAYFLITSPGPHPLPISPQDKVSSWETPAPYRDGGELEARAEAEIKKLLDAQGGEQFSTYDIYVGVAQWKELLGDGKGAYEYLGRAVNDNPKRSLAYGNLGHVLKKVGAFTTARAAFEKAIELEPQFVQNHIAYIEFLVRDAPGVATLDVDEAFEEALLAHPDSDELLSKKQEWLTNTGR